MLLLWAMNVEIGGLFKKKCLIPLSYCPVRTYGHHMSTERRPLPLELKYDFIANANVLCVALCQTLVCFPHLYSSEYSRCKHRRSSLVAGGLTLGANLQLDYKWKFPMFRLEEASIAAETVFRVRWQRRGFIPNKRRTCAKARWILMGQ